MTLAVLPTEARDIARVRTALDSLEARDPEACRALFRRGCTIGADDHLILLQNLVALGLVEHDGLGEYRARFASYHIQHIWFLTDLPSRRDVDSIFPLYPESRYFVEHMHMPQGARALDLCTGSGLYAIFAAQHARSVIAVDINPRALAFAQFNLALNGVANKVELRLGDLFEPVRGQQFDYISANPPFEPTPPSVENYWHSDGGSDGLMVVRKLMADVSQHLSPTGCLEMVSFSLIGDVGILFARTLAVPENCVGSICVVAEPVALLSFALRFNARDIVRWLISTTDAGWKHLNILWIRLDPSVGVSPASWVIDFQNVNEARIVDWTDPE